MKTMQHTTFWKFISEHQIEIPIIQRDYAQGRIGREKLREKFLHDLKKALDNAIDNNDSAQQLKLDFVYGNLDDNRLNPLDGQQRLTTLWLLHWYIAYKSGNLDADNKEIFKQLSYETRTSSREFCKHLSSFTTPMPESVNGKPMTIVKHIQNQTWFLSAWKQDPTIQAMLIMLGGTSDDENKDDGIEGVFDDNNNSDIDWGKYWKKLTNDDCPIIFYFMPMHQFALSDDLYIKMNARGKQLTNFENFKADLIKHLRESFGADKENKELNIDYFEFERNIDNDWIDIFWNHKSPEEKIDDSYIAFFNRFFLNYLMANPSIAAKDIDSNDTFKYLYGNGGDDSTIEYSGFSIYKPTDKDKNLFDANAYISISNILNNLKKALGEDENTVSIISKYLSQTLTQPQRVIFYAICSYFEKGEYEEANFSQWMRIVSNIVENADIDTIESMVGAIRLINELKEHSHSIYRFLSDDKPIKSTYAKEQIEEERQKVKMIGREDCNMWEKKITDAENFAFFNGAIRFLFTDNKGTYNWNLFDIKFENCQKYFDKKGVKDDGDTKYKTDAILLKAVISRCTNFAAHVWNDKYIFDNSAVTWKKNLLLNKSWKEAIDAILLGETNIATTSPDEEGFNDKLYQDLFKTDLLNYVANHQPDSRMKWIHGNHAIYQRYREGIILNDDTYNRNEILFELEKEGIITVDNNKITKDNEKEGEQIPFYKGWDIKFVNNQTKKEYQWHRNRHIYPIENDKWINNEDGAPIHSKKIVTSTEISKDNILEEVIKFISNI